MTTLPFPNRQAAGKALAKHLLKYKGADDTLILALVRGGIPVGRALADELGLPLYPYVVRKVWHPMHREYGLGAIAGEGAMYLDEITLMDHGLTEDHLKSIIDEEKKELARRWKLYCPAPLPNLEGKTLIITDDGAATGVSMLAAIRELRKQRPKSIISALPLAAMEVADKLKKEADELITVATPADFEAISKWYIDFPQVEDDEVLELLKTRQAA